MPKMLTAPSAHIPYRLQTSKRDMLTLDEIIHVDTW